MTTRDDQIRRILQEVRTGIASSHRSISAQVRLSLGLTNELLQELVRRELVRVAPVRAHRHVYAITPDGETELARLSKLQLLRAVDYYEEARARIWARLVELSSACDAAGGGKRVIFYGTGRATEIACACAAETDLEVIGVVGSGGASQIGGIPVRPASCLESGDRPGHDFDRLLVMSIEPDAGVQAHLERIGFPKDRVWWL